MQMIDDKKYMQEALKEAQKAFDQEEVPVGAVVVVDGKVVARAHNSVEKDRKASRHAEVKALDEASEKLGAWRLEEATLYVTLEPCAMCAGAIINSRVKRLVIGAMDEKRGCCGSLINLVQDGAFNHQVELETRVLDHKSVELLQAFFRKRR